MQKYNLPNEPTSVPTALRRAAMDGQTEDVRFLCSRIDDVNAADDNPAQRKTALHWASQRGHANCASILLDAGADHTLGDAEGKTALDYANDEIRELFRAKTEFGLSR